MTQLEEALRLRLQAAAEAAPVFVSLDLTEPLERGREVERRSATSTRQSESHRLRRRRAAVFAGLAASVLFGSASLWQSQWLTTWSERGPVSNHETSVDAGGLCAGELVLNGATYLPVGDLTRVPRAGDSWGPAEWTECADREGPPQGPADVTRVDGIAGDDVFLAEGQLWLRLGVTLPAGLAETRVAVPCARAGHIVGLVEGVDRMPEADGAVLQLPFVATIRATQGSALDFSQFPVQIVNVLMGSAVGSGSELVTSSLADGSLVDLMVKCEGNFFVADSAARTN